MMPFLQTSTGNVPCPIIYGAIVDSTCQFWEDKCGQVGACRMYESHMFRKLFHGVTAALMFLAFLVDVVVWLKAGSINFPGYYFPISAMHKILVESYYCTPRISLPLLIELSFAEYEASENEEAAVPINVATVEKDKEDESVL